MHRIRCQPVERGEHLGLRSGAVRPLGERGKPRAGKRPVRSKRVLQQGLQRNGLAAKKRHRFLERRLIQEFARMGRILRGWRKFGFELPELDRQRLRGALRLGSSRGQRKMPLRPARSAARKASMRARKGSSRTRSGQRQKTLAKTTPIKMPAMSVAIDFPRPPFR